MIKIFYFFYVHFTYFMDVFIKIKFAQDKQKVELQNYTQQFIEI